MLRMMDINNGFATGNDLCNIDLNHEEFKKYRLEYDDILFNRTNSHDLVGRTGIYRLFGEHVFASYLIRIKVDKEKIIPFYLSTFLNSPLGRRQIMRYATRGVSQTNVNSTNLCNVLIPLPSIEEQKNIINKIDIIQSMMDLINQRFDNLTGFANKIVEQYFGGNP